jgi:hypothetical protein
MNEERLLLLLYSCICHTRDGCIGIGGSISIMKRPCTQSTEYLIFLEQRFRSPPPSFLASSGATAAEVPDDIKYIYTPPCSTAIKSPTKMNMVTLIFKQT